MNIRLRRISKGQFPPANKYIVALVSSPPWVDSFDPYNVRWKVVRCVYGISQKTRIELAEKGDSRSKIYRFGDEYGNNIVPYEFKEFGPSSYFGQDIDYWFNLPSSRFLVRGDYEK